MSPRYIDAQGREHDLLIAERDIVVYDEALEFNRRIVAGQPVPPELLESYKQGGKEKPKRGGRSRKQAEKPESEKE